jgi:CheY-like chemotaxis protein
MQTRQVLIIDDEEMVRNTISSALSSAGYSPVPAGSVHEAIECMNSSSPDLIISDIYMNDGDGFQVLSHARGQPTTVATPFLLMTGRPDPPSPRNTL